MTQTNIEDGKKIGDGNIRIMHGIITDFLVHQDLSLIDSKLTKMLEESIIGNFDLITLL
jgi:hypothetical protein